MENITVSINTNKINTKIAKNMSLYLSRNDIIQSLNKNTSLSVFNIEKQLNDKSNEKSNEKLNEKSNAKSNEKSNNLSNKLFGINLFTDNTNTDIKKPKCSICIENFEDGDIIRTTICSHSFHQKCSDKWFEFKMTCPNCRKMII
jgi:hypothetical protein